jgi:hypothetical protein
MPSFAARYVSLATKDSIRRQWMAAGMGTGGTVLDGGKG